MNALSNDELAAIFALGNLTGISARAWTQAEILKAPSPSDVVNDHESVNTSECEEEDKDEEDDDDEEEDSDVMSSDSSSIVGVVSPIKNCNNNAQHYIEETVKKMRSVCSDAILVVLSQQLDTIIRNVCEKSAVSASTSFLKNIMKDNNDSHLQFLKEIADKEFLFKVEVFLKATAVYFLSLQMLNIHDEIDSVEELLEEYSQYLLFAECADDADEARYLLYYRNYMKKALRIIPPKRNKLLLTNICSLLEGSRRTYITGGTQSSATTRRIIVYEHESGYKKKCRPERRRSSANKKALSNNSAMDMVKCVCGAVIRRRTTWKHHRSKKHLNFLHPPPTPSSASASPQRQPGLDSRQPHQESKLDATQRGQQQQVPVLHAAASPRAASKPQQPALYLPQYQQQDSATQQPSSSPADQPNLPLPQQQAQQAHTHQHYPEQPNLQPVYISQQSTTTSYQFPLSEMSLSGNPHHLNYSLAYDPNLQFAHPYLTHSLPHHRHQHPPAADQLPYPLSNQLSQLFYQQPFPQMHTLSQFFSSLPSLPPLSLPSLPPQVVNTASGPRLMRFVRVDPQYVYQNQLPPPSWLR